MYSLKSPKNVYVALFLCLFLGMYGVHRYYVGKIGTGLLWTFTGGVFLIGWISDVISIFSEKFTDRDGFVLQFRDTHTPPAPAESPFNVSINSQWVTVDREDVGELSLADIGGYESPAGGFVNYAPFRVTGKSVTTGRNNTRRYEARDEAAARELALADGLTDPFTFEVAPHREPTERQLEYALDLGVSLPDGVCFDDISTIITRVVDFDVEESPDPGFSRYAHDMGVMFSRFAGRVSLLSHAVAQLKGEKLATLYAYCVYLQDKSGDLGDPRKLPFYDKLCAVGADLASDPVFMKSIESRDRYDFLTPSKQTNAYKVATFELRRYGII